MHTNVSSKPHTKITISRSGENLVCSLYCCTYHGLRDSSLLWINYQASRSLPPLSRNHDHRFSLLMRPANLPLLLLWCLAVVILQRVGFVILFEAASIEIFNMKKKVELPWNCLQHPVQSIHIFFPRPILRIISIRMARDAAVLLPANLRPYFYLRQARQSSHTDSS